LRSAFGVGSVVEDESVLLGIVLLSVDDGALCVAGVVDWSGVAAGMVVEPFGDAAGLCICSVAGAPCDVLSVVCAYAKPIAPTIVAAATAAVKVLDALISILLRCPA
jgi:hypothetical protein